MSLETMALNFLTWSPWRSVPATPTQPSDRERLIARLLDLEAQSAVEAAARTEKIEHLTESLREAEARVLDLRHDLRGVHEEQLAASFRTGAELDRLRTELAASCPSAVNVFLEKVSAEIERLQHASNITPELIHRLEGLRAARAQAAALRCAPLTAAEVLNALQRIERHVPQATDLRALVPVG